MSSEQTSVLIISNMSHIIKQIIQCDKGGLASVARPDRFVN